MAFSPFQRGAFFVFASALTWSFGGAMVRFMQTSDSFAVIFWRSFFAALFLLGFMLKRDGWQKSRQALQRMRWPSLAVALCFVTASMCFVTALNYTTVANVLLMQAGTPLLAALMAWILFREKVAPSTWLAIAAVILGVGIMVSGSLSGEISPIGDGLALLIATAFAISTTIARRHAEIDMLPAVLMGCCIAMFLAALQVQTWQVSYSDLALLFAFGALNLGLGLAFYTAGVRLIAAPVAALIGVAEPVFGPIWVWLIHNEVPSSRTLLGGALVFFALCFHIGWQIYEARYKSKASGSLASNS